uniref:COMM domain-containing protein 3 n=1 Tax=Lates calcarifer TaxID=8187 RepID=A0A4W6FNA1_LATCA
MKLHFRPESCSFSFLSGITDDFSIFASHSLCACSTVSAPRLSPLLLLLHTPPPPLPHATSADPSRGLVSWVSLSRKMELSESVQRGLQSLADPSSFDQSGFQVLTGVSFRSLLSSHGDPGVLDQPELKQIDQILLKQCHTAAITFILEAVRHNADKSTISSCLEELTFSAERVEIFYSAYEKHKKELERLLASIGRRRPHVNDVSWRLQYHMKVIRTSFGVFLFHNMSGKQRIKMCFFCQNSQVDKVNEPFYLISLNTENEGSSEDINFTCTMEQLQVEEIILFTVCLPASNLLFRC